MSRATEDLQMGEKFGKLTVLHKVKQGNPTHHAYYECVCECGETYKARGSLLRAGTTTRCRRCANQSMAEKKKGVSVGGPAGTGRVAAPAAVRDLKQVAADLLILAVKLTSRHSDAKPLMEEAYAGFKALLE